MSAIAEPTRWEKPTTRPATASDALGPRLAAPERKPLGEQLVDAGLLSEDDLAAVLKTQWQKGKRVGDLLFEMGIVDESKLLPFVAAKLGVSGVRLREGIIDPHAVRVIPQEVAQRVQALALFQVRGVLTVAMAEPQNLQQIDELEQLIGLRVSPICAFSTSIVRMIDRVYSDERKNGVDAQT